MVDGVKDVDDVVVDKFVHTVASDESPRFYANDRLGNDDCCFPRFNGIENRVVLLL